MLFHPKLVLGTCEIHCIPCACTSCTYILDQLWIPGFTAYQQPCYQPVQDFKYWPVLGSFNNFNIIKLSHKAISSEKIDKIHQVVLDGIIDNMATLAQTDKYIVINITYTTTMVYYVIKFFS